MPTDFDARIAALPAFTDDPIDRLRHSLAAYDESPNEDWAIHATYDGSRDTGVTWGDLRQTLAIVDELRNP